MSAFDGNVALMARGGCTAAPKLSVTTDGRATFTTLTPPAPHILRVVPAGPTSGWVIGASAACKPAYYSTTDGGATWTAAPTVGKVWFAVPSGVHTPSPGKAKLCGAKAPTAVALAPAGQSNALVVCDSGVFRTTNGGRSCHPVTTLPAGTAVDAALAARGKGFVLLRHAANCAGLRVVATSDLGKAWSTGQCLIKAKAPVGASLTDSGTGLIVAKSTTYTSADYGTTWRRR